MRVLAGIVAAIPVVAVDLAFFEDTKCEKRTAELKMQADDSKKVKLGLEDLSITGVGTCHEFGDGDEYTIQTAGGDKIKYKYGKVNKCEEYGAVQITLFTKDLKECKYKKPAEMKATDTQVITGVASMCFPGMFHGGALSSIGAQITDKDGKGTTSYRINCNPSPANVASIVMGTLSIVFALAGIGLAVAAKGK